MKVDVAVHGRFHGFDLASGLHRRRLLGHLLTTYPTFAVRRICAEDLPLKTIPRLEILRRTAQKAGFTDYANELIIPRFGNFVAAHVERSAADVLIGWSSTALEAISVAHRRGIAVAIDRGAAHIRHQDTVLREAYRRHGLDYSGISRLVIERELAEYEAADRILVLSGNAAASFIDNGVPAEKLSILSPGVDAHRFRILEQPRREGKARVLFVGAVGIQKGIPGLLRAFASLSSGAELHLVGPIEPAFRNLLSSLPTDGVTFSGPIPKARIHEVYAAADVFCLPSVQEGFGMVVLEAMASGLPVIISDQVGAADTVEQGLSGFVYPVEDEEALTSYLSSLIDDVDLRNSMGTAARAVAESRECGWDGYVDDLVLVLKDLAGR